MLIVSRKWRVFDSLKHFRTIMTSGCKGSVASSKIDVLGYNINYAKVGNGEHGVICLPGALGSIETDFKPQLEHLNQANKLTVVAWDPLGYGQSRPPDRDFSGGVQMFYKDAEIANELMQKLNFKTYSILGWSDGAITGLIMAGMFPNSIRKLVVWGGNAYVHEEDIKIYNSIRDIDNWSSKMKAPMIQIYGEQEFRRMWENWVDTFIKVYENNNGDICKKLLPNIICPTLIVHGEKDPMVGIEHANYLHEHIKNSKLHFMKEGKHNLHLRYYKEFNELVHDFLM